MTDHYFELCTTDKHRTQTHKGGPTDTHMHAHARTHVHTHAQHIRMQTHTYSIHNTAYVTTTGHEGVAAWLLSQKQCTGSEKDFIGSTPVHDAADEGRVRYAPILPPDCIAIATCAVEFYKCFTIMEST